MIVWPPHFPVWGGPWPLGPPPGYATEYIFICLTLIKKITYNMKREKKKFESDNVLDLVRDNHYDERSHIKSFSKLTKFDRINKCPLKESR